MSQHSQRATVQLSLIFSSRSTMDLPRDTEPSVASFANRYTTSFDDNGSCGLLMSVARCIRACDLPTFRAIRDHTSVFMTVLQNGKMSRVDRKLYWNVYETVVFQSKSVSNYQLRMRLRWQYLCSHLSVCLSVRACVSVYNALTVESLYVQFTFGN